MGLPGVYWGNNPYINGVLFTSPLATYNVTTYNMVFVGFCGPPDVKFCIRLVTGCLPRSCFHARWSFHRGEVDGPMEVISGQYSPVGRQTERSLRRLRTQVEAEEALLLGCVFLFQETYISRWWFQIFYMFTPTWGNDPIWLMFFRWVETNT